MLCNSDSESKLIENRAHASMTRNIAFANLNTTEGARRDHARGKSSTHIHGLLKKTGGELRMGFLVMLLKLPSVSKPLQAETAMLFEVITQSRLCRAQSKLLTDV